MTNADTNAENPRLSALTEEDRDEIAYLANVSDKEFAEALNDWLTLGDDDGSGGRVFLSPALLARTHKAVGGLIRQASVGISRARRGKGDTDTEPQLRRVLEELTRLRGDTNERLGTRRTRNTASDLPAFEVPAPTARQRLEIQHLADAPTTEFTAEVSFWAEQPDPHDSVAVFFSPALLERTAKALSEMVVATEQHRKAKRSVSEDAWRDLGVRLDRLQALRRPAAALLKVRRQEKAERASGEGSVRKKAYEVLAKLHPREFTAIRKAIEAGEAPGDVLARMRSQEK